MIQREVLIRNRLGLHARAAARFVHAASRFRSKVQIGHDGRMMDGKSILGILLLSAGRGTRILLTADGEDEEQALKTLGDLVDGGFGEEA